jgi:MFS transporter, DHA2 family, multidrug resistance protein
MRIKRISKPVRLKPINLQITCGGKRICHQLDLCPDDHFAVADVKRENISDAAGLTSLVRNLGGSVGIALLTTLVTRSIQAHQALLVGDLTPFAASFRNELAMLQQAFAARSGQAAQSQAYGVLYQTLQQQARLLAYVNQFRIPICFALVPLIFLFKKAKAAAEGSPVAH